MKKTNKILVIVVLIGFMLVNLGNKTTVAVGEPDLLKIASVLQDENILINEWSLHAREKMEMLDKVKEIKDYTEELKQQFPDWDWSEQSKEGHFEAVAIFEHGSETETIKILSTPIKGHFQTYVIYEVKGQGWDQKAEESFSKRMTNRITDIFRGNATTFSCIKGEFNDKIDKTLPLEIKHLLAVFKAKEVEALEEDAFISSSAYSTMFSESVEAGEKEINLQLGIRNQGMGGKTTIVVGTPIITIEY
ncbi:YwmB family TATA-box binding protein [Cytobacillus massiliigabonensis]|uniref:YwmB family TATA-box binding protein n=1 Tax=Cytobacillus massiliigabonensis TaxID=1871011 RepID=UPI001F1B4A19|nr:YwmB family TATA-box binding protein [Cytobacillus massiliigabonensis]